MVVEAIWNLPQLFLYRRERESVRVRVCLCVCVYVCVCGKFMSASSGTVSTRNKLIVGARLSVGVWFAQWFQMMGS
jgi:hypothetical protein